MSIRDSRDASLLSDFIRQFPNSPFSDLATGKLAKLEPVETEKLIVGQDPPSNGTSAKELDQLDIFNAIAAAEKVDTVRGWQLFLRKYGGSQVAKEALTGRTRGLKLLPERKILDDLQIERVLLSSIQGRMELQKGLISRGLLSGAPDGVIGDQTRNAIKTLQANLAVEATGMVDMPLLENLRIQPWNVPADSNYISDDLARTYDPKSIKILGEEPDVVELVRCFWPRRLVYGRFEGHLYAAVIGSIGYSLSETNAKLADCGLHLVSISSLEENAFVYQLVGKDDLFWSYERLGQERWKNGPMIGLMQASGSKEPGGGWDWTSGEKSNFRNWFPGQPNNFNKYDRYTSLYSQRSNGTSLRGVVADKWDDVFYFRSDYIVEERIPGSRLLATTKASDSPNSVARSFYCSVNHGQFRIAVVSSRLQD